MGNFQGRRAANPEGTGLAMLSGFQEVCPRRDQVRGPLSRRDLAGNPGQGTSAFQDSSYLGNKGMHLVVSKVLASPTIPKWLNWDRGWPEEQLPWLLGRCNPGVNNYD